ncbi:MAG: secondary thiamine-phosphate synthase enzyme YjbQ [Promethearchaeota archaeon]
MMNLISYNFSIRTRKREEFIEITDEIKDYVRRSHVDNGYIKIFVPHTTAAVTINENADIDVQRDLLNILRKIAPRGVGYFHAEGNSDAHFKSSLIGCTIDVFIENGKLILGQWQGIYFLEFDGPRTRKIYLQIYSAT